MLTTIQESVTVGRDGLIQLHARGLEYNSRISVVAVIESINKHKTNEEYQLSDFAGMWKNRDISVEQIRKKAWN